MGLPVPHKQAILQSLNNIMPNAQVRETTRKDSRRGQANDWSVWTQRRAAHGRRHVVPPPAYQRNEVLSLTHIEWEGALILKQQLYQNIIRERFPELGDIKRVTSCFSILDLPEDNIRFNKVHCHGSSQGKLFNTSFDMCVLQNFEPLGCLGDLGWYNVRACLFAFGEECLPESVWGTATLSDKVINVMKSLLLRLR